MNVYTLRYNIGRWPAGSNLIGMTRTRTPEHLDAHKVKPAEFEQLLTNDPVDLSFEQIDNEERYRSVGLTNGGRLLSVVWTVRKGKVRAIPPFRLVLQTGRLFWRDPNEEAVGGTTQARRTAFRH